jgi:hypothetical protein
MRLWVSVWELEIEWCTLDNASGIGVRGQGMVGMCSTISIASVLRHGDTLHSGGSIAQSIADYDLIITNWQD